MDHSSLNLSHLAAEIRNWAYELGFQAVGITDIDLRVAQSYLSAWLAKGYHGEMHYMSKQGTKRSHPEELLPNTLRVISVRMDYLPSDTKVVKVLQDPAKGYISRYALGRDYHKVVKKRLIQLAKKINQRVSQLNYRAFVDSAPILEKALAEKASLGWIGKNTLVISKKAGSWFFLGELLVNIPLPIDTAAENHCGSCQACIDICPTKAIIAPYQLDARRCISYLTIEHRSSIPIEFRKAIGNRIFGCDDCQIVCPWNKFAQFTKENDFAPRHNLANQDLITLFLWTENDFNLFTEGSAIRRVGYEGWLRNIAIALGNVPTSFEIINALQHRVNYPSALVQEHVRWALTQHV